jgi:hypothetical protein
MFGARARRHHKTQDYRGFRNQTSEQSYLFPSLSARNRHRIGAPSSAPARGNVIVEHGSCGIVRHLFSRSAVRIGFSHPGHGWPGN